MSEKTLQVHRWQCDCEHINPDWTADKIEVVRAADFDRLTAQLKEAREALDRVAEVVRDTPYGPLCAQAILAATEPKP